MLSLAVLQPHQDTFLCELSQGKSLKLMILLAVQGDNLVVCYLMDVHSVLQLRSLATGQEKSTIPLPGIGSVSAFQSRRQDSEAFFSYTDFVSPGSTFRCITLRQQCPATNPGDDPPGGNCPISAAFNCFYVFKGLSPEPSPGSILMNLIRWLQGGRP